MEKRRFVSTIVASLFVAACTTMPGGGGTFAGPHQEKAKECNGGGTCFVEVSATAVDPPYIVVNNKRQRIDIFFRPKDGVTIEKIDFGTAEFDCTSPGGSGQWKCDDKHSTFGVYKYTVTVKNVGTIDPWIVND